MSQKSFLNKLLGVPVVGPSTLEGPGAPGRSPRPACQPERGQADSSFGDKPGPGSRWRVAQQLPVRLELLPGARLVPGRRWLRTALFQAFGGRLDPSREVREHFRTADRTHLVLVNFFTVQAQTRFV